MISEERYGKPETTVYWGFAFDTQTEEVDFDRKVLESEHKSMLLNGHFGID